ncbi:hypothetical protein V6N13_139339 [Hibiscus sabdariffa]
MWIIHIHRELHRLEPCPCKLACELVVTEQNIGNALALGPRSSEAKQPQVRRLTRDMAGSFSTQQAKVNI